MKFKIGDIVVYIFIVILMGFSFLGLKWLSEATPEKRLVVEVGGEQVESIKLDEKTVSRDFKIHTEDGGYNTLNITQEGIRIIDANCPDQICVRSPRISVPGQTIICLPHRSIIKIEGDLEEENAVDGTAS